MTSTATKARRQRGAVLAQLAEERRTADAKARRIRIAWLLGLLLAVVVVTAGLLSARPEAGEQDHLAPDFTLPTTAGDEVTLSDLRGGPVVIYFNEGAGCASCTVQMAEIEKEPGFAEAGITVLPIVMNTAEQIQPDLTRYGVTTPYLIDDGMVSEAYGVLGTGMHAGLPGHGFVLIDADGVQRWQGEYPSMWLEPAKLLQEVTSRL
ncbi:peroxiredoxin [Georgenia soli]|uniref:Peroxiredoxin n=1 Tax=Georgenia soli TaxID=638953 RepID=A0A2A9F2L4_9MICO|nr:peroxiredoxin family protein [Georgenia soli]PFG44870.1 peroxiredoxin [Georgenia soli]PFG45011.1 peroxiredoxin [Georgenia soli]